MAATSAFIDEQHLGPIQSKEGERRLLPGTDDTRIRGTTKRYIRRSSTRSGDIKEWLNSDEVFKKDSFPERASEPSPAPTLPPARALQDGPRIFRLFAYTPGMNTSPADIQAVLEAEAALPASKRGIIDHAARSLFDAARSSGWQALVLETKGGKPATTIFFDGTGRYACERVFPPGIKERVICDGKTLLHLYTDLLIGARRTSAVSIGSILPESCRGGSAGGRSGSRRRSEARGRTHGRHGAARNQQAKSLTGSPVCVTLCFRRVASCPNARSSHAEEGDCLSAISPPMATSSYGTARARN